MSDLRAAAERVLAEYDNDSVGFKLFGALEDLRAALAEPVQEQAEPDAYGYASRLAVAIWQKHYKDTAPNWKPLNNLMSVLTQIKNMTAGLTCHEEDPVQEPVQEYASIPGTNVRVPVRSKENT